MEYLYTDDYLLRSVEANSLAPYTCAVKEDYFLTCLDLATPSTLSYAAGDANAAALVDVSFNASAEAHLFGSKATCDGLHVGDGVVNGLDLVVLMWYQFKVAPYAALPLTHPTVSIGHDAGARCEDDITREAYLAAYDVDSPCVIPQRRLEETRTSPLAVHRYRTVAGRGSWFLVRSEGTHAASELLLGGVDAPTTVTLSNERAPYAEDAEEDAPAQFEVRFARHAEYCARADTTECASVRGIVSTGIALYHNVLGLGQVPTEDRRELCAFDVFLFVPNAFECTVDVLAGSSVMDGDGGRRTEYTVMCEDAPPTLSLGCDEALPSTHDSMPLVLAVAIPIGVLLMVLALCVVVGVLRTRGRPGLRKAPIDVVSATTDADPPFSS